MPPSNKADGPVTPKKGASKVSSSSPLGESGHDDDTTGWEIVSAQGPELPNGGLTEDENSNAILNLELHDLIALLEPKNHSSGDKNHTINTQSYWTGWAMSPTRFLSHFSFL